MKWNGRYAHLVVRSGKKIIRVDLAKIDHTNFVIDQDDDGLSWDLDETVDIIKYRFENGSASDNE